MVRLDPDEDPANHPPAGQVDDIQLPAPVVRDIRVLAVGRQRRDVRGTEPAQFPDDSKALGVDQADDPGPGAHDDGDPEHRLSAHRPPVWQARARRAKEAETGARSLYGGRSRRGPPIGEAFHHGGGAGKSDAVPRGTWLWLVVVVAATSCGGGGTLSQKSFQLQAEAVQSLSEIGRAS